ncbi:hypothetical protein G6F37_000026 [Rhizopus arrhizus]|nr:hypothetical protein G6F38_010707 [Rhizopus arrhizus]KAG1164742.1 hypothetical protein G6F37_000026 [Rhizopus arrhizus]
MTQKTFKVLIAGGGVAGLTLANALKSSGIQFQVFERDEYPEYRNQGWSITCHRALDVLKRHIPQERFASFGHEVSVNNESNEPDVAFTFKDGQTGQDILSFASNGKFVAYRANRNRFRKWLLKDVENDVQWNKKVIHYEEKEDGVKVFFADGTQAEGDLLVATDGSTSPVTQQLLGDRFDSLTCINPIRAYGCTRWVTEEEWSELTKIRTQATIVTGKIANEDGAAFKEFSLFCTLNDIDRSRTEAPFEVFCFFTRYDPDRVFLSATGTNNAEILKMIKSWAAGGLPGSPAHEKLVAGIPDDTPMTEITIRERKPEFDPLVAPNRRVVIAGDAAHPMTMFRGDGANQAVEDIGALVHEIVHAASGTKSLDEAISDYYKEMIPRAQKAVQSSHEAAEIVHTKPDEIYNTFKHVPEQAINHRK